MSLKTFHIVFITVSTVLALGFGFWAIRGYQARGEGLLLVAGVGSLMGGVLLMIYGRWFLHKLRGVSYL